MRTSEIGAGELLQHLQVPGAGKDSPEENIYVIGSFERRVTLYSQQVRALNLAHALFAQGRLRPGSRVAVIGGGVAGVTAAVALAHLGATVQLIERTDVLLPFQKACRTRWLHPRIYDWPEQDSDNDSADLPLVPWTASYADEVSRQLQEAFEQVVARTSAIQITLSAVVQDLSGGSPVRLSWQGMSPAGESVTTADEEFDAAVIAVGFGIEEGTDDLPMSSYWRNDDLDQPVLGRRAAIECLVSGNGDGGIIDVLRLRLRNFQLETLHTQLQSMLSPSDHERVLAHVRMCEAQASEKPDTWLWARYKELAFSDEFKRDLGRLLRTDTKVWIASAKSPISFRSAALNRLWISLLVRFDPGLKWIRSATKRVTKQKAGTKVVFVEDAANTQFPTTYDRVIVRHGPTPALSDALKWIDERCRPTLSARNTLDATRWPIWIRGVTFGPEGPTSTASLAAALSSAPRDVALGVDGPALARPGVMDEREVVLEAVAYNRDAAERVAAALSEEWARAAHAPGMTPSKELLPGGARSIMPALFARRAIDLEVLLTDSVAPAVTFLDHCRVDPDVVTVVTRKHEPTPPELRWHPTVQHAKDLVLRSAGGLDEPVKPLPSGRPSRQRRADDLPAFRRTFFMNLDRLRAGMTQVQDTYQMLWSFLAGARREVRAAAVQTFASFAALRVIAALRAFEGMLRTDDGQSIVNLFPDLPPIKSSWLLRRMPYASQLGELSFHERQFLLCRVVDAERTNYVLLPRRLAEAAQDDPAGLSELDVARWITPQWFFQGYPGTPGPRPIVGVLIDEYGRERHKSDAATPWQDEPMLEEPPHDAMATGELRELQTDWHVLVAGIPDQAPRSAGRSPLVGRRILWVDDIPANNTFEIGYLEQLGATLSYATSTAFALEVIAKEAPDLVITDLRRLEAGIDHPEAGLELRQQLAARSARLPTPPLVLYTGDLSRVPPDMHPMAAERAQDLFDLIEKHIDKPTRHRLSLAAWGIIGPAPAPTDAT